MNLDAGMCSHNDPDLPFFCTARVLILGCGNRFYGDDGFGPAVADHLLTHYVVPEDVSVSDAGIGVRKLLFTLCLSESRPDRIILVDAMDVGRSPGEIFEVPLEDVPQEKRDDFSLHQAPTSDLARELKDSGIDIRVLVCQVAHVPQEISVGFSDAVARAVPVLCEQIAREEFGGMETARPRPGR